MVPKEPPGGPDPFEEAFKRVLERQSRAELSVRYPSSGTESTASSESADTSLAGKKAPLGRVDSPSKRQQHASALLHKRTERGPVRAMANEPKPG